VRRFTSIELNRNYLVFDLYIVAVSCSIPVLITVPDAVVVVACLLAQQSVPLLCFPSVLHRMIPIVENREVKRLNFIGVLRKKF
jgi:hypothetical protein